MGCALYDSSLIYSNFYDLSAGNNYMNAVGAASMLRISWTDHYNLASNWVPTEIQFRTV